MKIHIIGLLLTIGVILNFGVSSSTPVVPPNQPTAPPVIQRTSRIRYRSFPDRPDFDKKTGELVAIFHNAKRYRIADLGLKKIDPNDIPDGFYLHRRGQGGHRGLQGRFYNHKIYDAHCINGNFNEVFESQKNDFVTDPTESRILGMFFDHGKYYEFYYQN